MVKYLNHRVSNSPDYIRGIRKAFGELPIHIQEIARKCGYDIDTLPRPSPHQGTIDKNRRDNISVAEAPRVLVSDSEEDTPPKAERISKTERLAFLPMINWAQKERGFEFLSTLTGNFLDMYR
jgi:hypothetical protein